MLRALFSGVSGLDTSTLRMDVVGNNIANVNTIGFKRSRVTFEDAVSQLIQGATAPSGSLGGSNPKQVGTGARLGSVDRIFAQGSFEQTGVATDLALQGNAFFIVSDGEQQLYTRVGAFQLDGNGRLVDPVNRYIVQGFGFDRATNEYATTLGEIRVPIGQTEPARATTGVVYQGNLSADSEPAGTRAESGVFRDVDGAAASGAVTLVDLRADAAGVVPLLGAGDKISFSATVGGEQITGTFDATATSTMTDLLNTVQTALNSVTGISGVTLGVDASGRISLATPNVLGAAAEVKGLIIQAQDNAGVPRDDFNSLAGLVGTQTARDTGEFSEESVIYDSLGFSHVLKLSFTRTLDANQFTWAAEVDGGETPVLAGTTGRVTFNNDGSLSGFFFDPVGDTLPTKLTIGPKTGARSPFEVELNPGSIGEFDGLTLLQASSTVEATQDGFTQGKMVDFTIDRTGVLSARFSNGVTRPIGMIALAEFVNAQGLELLGGEKYMTTSNSGEARVGVSGSVATEILSGAIEQSNVDLAREFSNMILAQRGFQASARVITTSDEILSELLNLKR